MEETPCLFAGLDVHWDQVQAHLLDGSRSRTRGFAADAAGLAKLADWLRVCAGARLDQLVVAVERPDGPVTESLVSAGFAVYAINPKQADSYREFTSAAGAKDDRRDAEVLAAAARADLSRFQRVAPPPELIALLRELTRTHEDLRGAENGWANRLRELLHRYFPALLQLARDTLLDPFCWELLERYPTPAEAAQAPLATIEELVRKHRLRRFTADQVVELLRAPGLELLPGTAKILARQVLAILPMLRTACEQRQAVEQQIEATLAELQAEQATDDDPGDVALALSYRGLGTMGCARLFGEGWAYLEARDLEALRCRGGCAPVTRASGRSWTTQMRRACNQHLRRGLHDWARGAALHDPWAKAHFADLRRRGHSVERAYRGVVDRTLEVLMAMLRDRTRYDPDRRHPRPLADAA